MLVIIFATDESIRPLQETERTVYKECLHRLLEEALQEPYLANIEIVIAPPGARVKVDPSGEPSKKH